MQRQSAQHLPATSPPPRVQPQTAATEPATPRSPEPEFFNRELSWLEFNRRVLHEAVDARTPLLERVRFLSIFTSNLDEFFMKRVGGLRRQQEAGLVSRSLDGLTVDEQIAAIRKSVIPLLETQARCWREEILPELERHGISIVPWERLTPAEKMFAHTYFHANVFPVLTPLAVDFGHPFPFISNLSMSLGVAVRHPDEKERLFARVKVPALLPRLVQLPSELSGDDRPTNRYLRMIDIIRHHLDALFPEMVVMDVMAFRVTRNADVERDEEDAEDLLEMMAQELRRRRFERVVRLEHGPDPSPWLLDFLKDALKLDDAAIYELDGELDYTDLGTIADLNIRNLCYEPWVPVRPPALADDDADIFSVIRSGDVFVHHPFESFNSSVERFLASAADDPRVLAIKMTVYRTSDDSPFMRTLIRAAEAGKSVVCLVELKARFDEARNIAWAQRLEQAGVHVVYGVVGLKTHAKIALVVRREPEGNLRSYVHVGTGNYHSGTARLYTDCGLLTCRPDITGDIVELFHYLTGRSLKKNYRRVLVAPVNMAERFIAMIEREVEHLHAGNPAGITVKMNSLEDPQICRALYHASQAGLSINAIVRGFCCLRAGVPGLSENIHVMSLVGRFLEHSRIFHFRNGQEDPLEGDFYIGSADWMSRNLYGRVEAITPVDDHSARERLWTVLSTILNDRRQVWDLQPDGSYVQRTPRTPEEEIGTHRILMDLARQRSAGLSTSS